MFNTVRETSPPAPFRAMRLHPCGSSSAHKANVGAPHWVQAAGHTPAPGAPLATSLLCICGFKPFQFNLSAGLTSRSRGTRRDAARLQYAGFGSHGGFAQPRHAARPLPWR